MKWILEAQLWIHHLKPSNHYFMGQMTRHSFLSVKICIFYQIRTEFIRQWTSVHKVGWGQHNFLKISTFSWEIVHFFMETKFPFIRPWETPILLPRNDFNGPQNSGSNYLIIPLIITLRIWTNWRTDFREKVGILVLFVRPSRSPCPLPPCRRHCKASSVKNLE